MELFRPGLPLVGTLRCSSMSLNGSSLGCVMSARGISPDYEVADVATVGRPKFDPDRFFVGLYAWRSDRRVLTQDLIIGSTKDGSVQYHSGRWTGMPDSTTWRSILELGEDARESGDFGAFHAGNQTYLADHRNISPSSSQYESRIWDELEKARTRPTTPLSTDTIE